MAPAGGHLNHWFITSDIYRAAGYPGGHPLGIQRIGTVLALCEQLGWLTKSGPRAPLDSPIASFEQLAQYHDSEYISALIAAERDGLVPSEVREKYRIGTAENPLFQGLYKRASTAVGGSILAAQLAMRGGVAYHPSGGTHHAMRDHAAGFCYFNDPVFAVLEFLKQGSDRVLYVDIDAHHGDGVEAAFRNDERVFLISIHEENRWPYTGGLDERASGNARNLPVPRNFNDSEMDYLMNDAILPIAERFRPDAVVVTCGADGLLGDPLSAMALSNACLWDTVMSLTGISRSTVVLGGGGYNPWTVARCWTGLWGRICGYEIPKKLPSSSVELLEGLDCDLVDDEDRLEFWTSALGDPRNDGPVRGQVRDCAMAILAEA
jgi:acetoin utilization protein AcuC